MLADSTAFVCVVFGYFFFWTIHDDFPPDPSAGPGTFWPTLATFLLLGAWALTLAARQRNRVDARRGFYVVLLSAMLFALAGAGALLAGPWLSDMNPTQHVYPATVWVLVGWTTAHVGLGVLMQLYCLARSLAGRMTAQYDIDIANVALYWHFCALTIVITVLVVAGFPLAA